jgi:pyruvate/2-oxoglutarate dehydrogenase complex dihydrolipoamide acyltransferase (E2) component
MHGTVGWFAPMHEIPVTLPDVLAPDEAIVFGQWLVEDGAVVMSGERIAEVLSAGVLVYVAAPAEGTLIRSNIMPGSPLMIAATLGVVRAADEETPGE